ncbi:class I SAM-dependent methyltransferase [Microbulbifer agarilyticus]|uniref:class I SAM-dependent methyltransferase n=1 Tax=Microbulbifer agarilyticus TaxID=260552 RepID=UPI001C988E93|nr:class I SAM-dependent methyltransferase [Microbulbifer agarilyticus]MBY6189569.1 class I SAM-dependent methyltransferase [Microbulbifer agarilyticus]
MSKAYNEMSYVEVAAIYNDINNIPLDAAADLGKAAADLVGEGAKIMDFGGGAGRISVPIASHTDMIAMDIEHHMLKASKKLAEDRNIRARQSVGTVLQTPFATNTFDAVITTNVLHQVEFWRDALKEAARVLKPEGVFIIGRDVLDEESNASALRSQSRMFTVDIAPEMRPTDAAGPTLFQEIQKLGGQMTRPVVGCKWIEKVSIAEIMDRMENGVHNETWSLSREQIDALMAKVRPWAESHFDDIHAVEDVQWEFHLYPINGIGK